MQERIERLLEAPWARVFQWDAASQVFTATVVEIPGAITEGETLDGANAMLNEAMGLWLEAELERGHDIPTPLAERDFSGRITVRLGPGLHERAVLLAAQENISLNRWISAAVAAYAGERAGAPLALPRNVAGIRAVGEGPAPYADASPPESPGAPDS